MDRNDETGGAAIHGPTRAEWTQGEEPPGRRKHQPGHGRRGRAPVGRVTEESLLRAALRYVERFASSTQSLRRVLERRVARSATAHDLDRDEAAAWIEAVIDRLTRAGLLDDLGFAVARARSLFERGTSDRLIRAKLAQKGLARDVIDQALKTVFADDEDPERRAAVRFARRRRLGPYRLNADGDGKRMRDLAAMARAGFPLDLARSVIDGDAVSDEA